MRKFTLGSGTDRKIVVIEVIGTRMRVVQMMPGTAAKRSEKDLGTEAEARSASDQMARHLISRDYAEQDARRAEPAKTGPAASKPATGVRPSDADAANHAFDDLDAPAARAAPVLPRLASAPGVKSSAGDAPQKKKKTGDKKKKQKAQTGNALDRRVLACVGAVGVVLLGIIAFVAYDLFIKPSTIVGVWGGGLVEHVISRRLASTKYDLILDDKGQAAFAIKRPGEESKRLVGTYVVKGNRLKLAVTDEDGDHSVFEYKIALGAVTLELFDLESGKLLVQMLRSRDKPVVRPHPPRRPDPPERADVDADPIQNPDE
jgi:hypothetical protein